jgi:hypothetical protein
MNMKDKWRLKKLSVFGSICVLLIFVSIVEGSKIFKFDNQQPQTSLQPLKPSKSKIVKKGILFADAKTEKIMNKKWKTAKSAPHWKLQVMSSVEVPENWIVSRDRIGNWLNITAPQILVQNYDPKSKAQIRLEFSDLHSQSDLESALIRFDNNNRNIFKESYKILKRKKTNIEETDGYHTVYSGTSSYFGNVAAIAYHKLYKNDDRTFGFSREFRVSNSLQLYNDYSAAAEKILVSAKLLKWPPNDKNGRKWKTIRSKKFLLKKYRDYEVFCRFYISIPGNWKGRTIKKNDWTNNPQEEGKLVVEFRLNGSGNSDNANEKIILSIQGISMNSGIDEYLKIADSNVAAILSGYEKIDQIQMDFVPIPSIISSSTRDWEIFSNARNVRLNSGTRGKTYVSTYKGKDNDERDKKARCFTFGESGNITNFIYVSDTKKFNYRFLEIEDIFLGLRIDLSGLYWIEYFKDSS